MTKGGGYPAREHLTLPQAVNRVLCVCGKPCVRRHQHVSLNKSGPKILTSIILDAIS